MPDLNAQFWESRWQNGQTGWDIGSASPALTRYVDQIPESLRPGMTVLIPGCGNGYEALYLLDAGFKRITMLDFAPSAVENMKKMLTAHFGDPVIWKASIQLLNEDFFTHEGQYDLILEQTFFCALDPALRVQYVAHMHHLLTPGGKLVGLLFDRHFEGGPPFGGCAAEYRALLAQAFYVPTMTPCYHSIPPRAGSEVFFIAQKT